MFCLRKRKIFVSCSVPFLQLTADERASLQSWSTKKKSRLVASLLPLHCFYVLNMDISISHGISKGISGKGLQPFRDQLCAKLSAGLDWEWNSEKRIPCTPHGAPSVFFSLYRDILRCCGPRSKIQAPVPHGRPRPSWAAALTLGPHVPRAQRGMRRISRAVRAELLSALGAPRSAPSHPSHVEGCRFPRAPPSGDPGPPAPGGEGAPGPAEREGSAGGSGPAGTAS